MCDLRVLVDSWRPWIILIDIYKLTTLIYMIFSRESGVQIVSRLLRVIYILCDLQYGALALTFHDFAFFEHFLV